MRITTETYAWTETPQTLDERQAWFARQQDHEYPVLVADESDAVIGFAAYADFRGDGKWPGYRFTVEHTIHVREDVWGRGIGRGAPRRAHGARPCDDIHVMVAAIDSDNTASIAFHERMGFTTVARHARGGLQVRPVARPRLDAKRALTGRECVAFRKATMSGATSGGGSCPPG